MKTDPKAPCPCGSKKKYRDCCKPKRDRNRLILILLIGATGIFIAKETFVEAPAAPPGKVWDAEHGHYHDAPTGGGAAATGIPPASSAAGNGAQNQGSAPQSGGAPPGGAPPGGAPPGEAPPGKVWDPAHGHYHDAPAGSVPPQSGSGPVNAGPVATPQPGQQAPGQAQPVPQPDGPVPPGKVWSTEHGHWHEAANVPADSSN